MILSIRTNSVAAFIFLILFARVMVQAAIVEYDLTIAQQEANITGKPTRGMTINGGIPGPTLRFQEGDIARIHVHNKMDVDTSIHWHGVLVPPDMDGVPYVSFPPIKAGTTFTYEFPIRHNGTYWYHSHTGLQEQKGVYGGVVIEPREVDRKADRDYVVMLSDWTDEGTHEVLRTLKRGNDWYSLEKGSAQSIIGAARVGMLGDYFKRELLRMPSMDISDIAYDLFLANGQSEIALPAEPGQTVRLRIIDAEILPILEIEGAHIQSRGHGDIAPPRRQGFGEVQSGVAKQAAPVDMGLADIHQLRRIDHLGHPDNNPHSHLRRLAMTAIKKLTVLAAQFHRHCVSRSQKR